MAKKTSKKKAAEKQMFNSENIQIEFRPYENGSTVGFATLTLFDCITIYNCVVMRKKNDELFVAMPSYKGKDGSYYSYVYIDKDDELSEEMNDLINNSLELPFD